MACRAASRLPSLGVFSVPKLTISRGVGLPSSWLLGKLRAVAASRSVAQRARNCLFWRARFEPCEWSDLSCHALVDIAAEAGTPLTGIVGHHKNAGTWLKGYAEAEAGAAAASPYLGTALRGLRLRLRHETWPTLVRSPWIHTFRYIRAASPYLGTALRGLRLRNETWPTLVRCGTVSLDVYT
jgi:hypothetical protein